MPVGKPSNHQYEQYFFQNVSVDANKAKEIEFETRGQGLVYSQVHSLNGTQFWQSTKTKQKDRYVKAGKGDN